MMKIFILALTVLLSLLIGPFDSARARAPLQWPTSIDEVLYGRTPDKSIKKWIRIILLTPRSGPSPIILISPAKFDVHSPQHLISLQKAQYLDFVQYSRANRCELASRKFLPWEVLEATEYSNEHTQILCRMSLPAACQYLSGMETLPDIDWMEPKWQPLKRVRADLRCE